MKRILEIERKPEVGRPETEVRNREQGAGSKEQPAASSQGHPGGISFVPVKPGTEIPVSSIQYPVSPSDRVIRAGSIRHPEHENTVFQTIRPSAFSLVLGGKEGRRNSQGAGGIRARLLPYTFLIFKTISLK